MTGLVVLVGIGLVLFAGSFFSKRRFGLLGLALAAGYVLSLLWLDTAEFMVAMTGFVPTGVVSHFIATVALLLLPPVLLFFHGTAYKTVTGRIVGSFLFTVLALGFLAEPMSKALVLDGVSVQAFGWLKDNAELIMGVGVMAAVFDMFISKPAVFSGSGRKR